MHVTHHQSNSLFNTWLAIADKLTTEAVNAELSPARREVRRGELLNRRRAHISIIAVGYFGGGCDAVAATGFTNLESSILVFCSICSILIVVRRDGRAMIRWKGTLTPFTSR